MAYELETIESRITENIFVAASESITFDVPEFLKELDNECAKVKKAFRQQVVSFENEKLVRRYFHFHQESLIDLINSIQSNVQTAGTADVFIESVVNRLSGLLTYLEDHFPEYFDLDMRMPLAGREDAKYELTSFVNSLSKMFGGTNIDFGLIELLKGSVDRFTERGEVLTFRKFYYLKFLRINLSDSRIADNGDTLDLIRVLFHCNFNEERFYAYMVRYITWSVDQNSSLNQKLEELAFFLKFSNQESSWSTLSFNHLHAPINFQIADWIAQEIQYLKHKQQLSPMSIGSEDVMPSEFKLNFDLSVASLAFLFRAFIETGIIQNENTSELIRFLTKYAKTKRSGSISYESLRIKYYSVEDGTKDAVQKALRSVLNFINKH